MTDMTISNEINRHIGGRAFFMMGTRTKLGDDTSLTFDIRGCAKINKIKVTLDRATDTYRVTFWKLGRAPKYTVTTVAEHDGIYCDMLHGLIARETGLALSL